MRQQKVTILPGETLWEGLKRENIIMDRSCGGKGTCGKCQVEIKGIGMVKSCGFNEPGVYDVILSQEEEFSVVEGFSGEGQFPEEKGAASTGGIFESLIIGIDLGTTTVAVKGITVDQTFTRSFVNPQRAYGADVMTRIENSMNGLNEVLEGQIKTRLYKTVDEIVVEAGGEKEIEVSIVISGNTTMLHLLRGLSCEGLGKAPFCPVELGLHQEKWNLSEILREHWPDVSEGSSKTEWQEREKICSVTYLPGISAFVGGDIVSGIYGLDLMEKKEISLLLDLGTNGEMALIKDKEVLVASAAAGPAFEGTPLALKLHAAGIINLLYFMRKENIIDEYGTLCDEYFEKGYPVSEAALNDRSLPEEKFSITQDDIRAIQMAKGAIRAGIDILLKEAEISPNQVSDIYLAGGMGFYLDAQKAAGIGLLPEGFNGRMEAVGNTSLHGALKYGKVMASGTQEEKNHANEILDRIVEEAREIVLAQHPDFEEEYVENMNFWEN